MLRIDIYTDIKNIDADTKKINEVIENNFSGEPEIEIVINVDRVVESEDITVDAKGLRNYLTEQDEIDNKLKF